MKDLILITAYCPDDVRENILRNLVNSLNKFKDTFDIMVVSHTSIPNDIQKKVNYAFYDSKNEILTDWDLLNQPWFNPNDERRIQSSFLSPGNTHLAIWRMLILGFSLSKNMGYEKVHHLEYDSIINDVSEIINNSKILDEYDSVYYIDTKETVDPILFGSFQSIKLSVLDPFLLNLNEEGIKEMIRNAETKSPELMFKKFLDKNNKSFKKNRHILETSTNKFGFIDAQNDNSFITWAVPFYDQLNNSVEFVVWNTKNEKGVEHTIIVNNSRVVNVSHTPLSFWKLVNLGQIDEIDTILVIENDKIRNKFNMATDEEKEIFKKSSFKHKEKF